MKAALTDAFSVEKPAGPIVRSRMEGKERGRMKEQLWKIQILAPFCYIMLARPSASARSLDRWQMGMRLKSCLEFSMRRSGKLVSCHVWEVTVELLVSPLCCLQWEARVRKNTGEGA